MPGPTIEFSVFDNQELVTYLPVIGPGVSDVPALRRPLTQSRQRNVERYADLHVTDVVFHLDGTTLAGATLAASDTIIDSNSYSYSVVFVARQSLGSIVVAIGRRV